MITETQIEEYFRAKVEEFRARGVPVNCLSTTYFPEFMRPLSFMIDAGPVSSRAEASLEDALHSIAKQKLHLDGMQAAELRAQAEQLLKSADELEGKV